MLNANYEWNHVDSEDEATIDEVASKFNVSPVTAKILVGRGYKTDDAVDKFLHPKLDQCYDPFLMHDMKKAVERIQSAIERGQQITVYGDYDADGLTSTSLMYETLLTIGANVDYYIPDRFKDGYGPNTDVFNRLIDNGTELIVTVDNGVAGNDAIDAASKKNVDVIVTDHHELPEKLPDAYAIVHPRYPGADYPFGDLSGVGVALKVAWALLEEFPTELLDLVAIGEIADLVSVTDENRVLITYGIQQLRMGMRPGIHELVKIAGLNEQTLDETNIGFGIAPRLNAIGRMGSAKPGVELLTCLDDEEAVSLATEIDATNKDRQNLVAEISSQALEQAKSDENNSREALLIAGNGWHTGVLGIVASRIVEQLGKPTIVVGIDEKTGLAKGSGRSIDGFDLFKAIDGHRELTEAFGGHKMAVGLTVKTDMINELRGCLDQSATDQRLSDLPKQSLQITSELTPDEANLDLYNEIEKLAPFGTDNARPIFAFTKFKLDNIKQIGKDNSHLKLSLDGSKTKLSAIAFNKGELAPLLVDNDNVKIAGTLDENEWHGNTNIQLMVKDVKISGIPVIDERTNHLSIKSFERDSTYVCFNHTVIKQLSQMNLNIQLIDAKEIQAGQLNNLEVTVVDCPPDLDAFRDLFKQGGKPSNIRLLLYQNDDAYLNGMPTRQELGKLYKFVNTHHDVNLRTQLDTLSSFLKINRNKLIFMIQMFFEVGFVKIDDGVLNGVDNPSNVDLKTSTAFNDRQQLIESEKVLIYSNSTDLRKWVLDCITSD